MTYNSNDQRTLPGVLQGVTAQNIGSAGKSITNSSSAQANVNTTPEDARPGYLAAGQPGGNPAPLVPGGQYSTDDQVQTIASPAGTAGGGGQYPAAATNPVANPMVAPAWTAQASTGDVESQLDITGPEFVSGQHAQTIANLATYTAAGGTGTGYTWTIVGALPTGVTQSGGVLSASTSTIQGSSSFQIKVTDSGSHTALKNVILNLS